LEKTRRYIFFEGKRNYLKYARRLLMEERNINSAPSFAEEAAALIAETLQVYERIKQLGGTDSGVDGQLSSLLLTQGLDQLVEANLYESDDEYNHRRIPLMDSSESTSSLSTKTIVTLPTSGTAPNSKVSYTHWHNSNDSVEKTKDSEQLRVNKGEGSRSVCSHNRKQTQEASSGSQLPTADDTRRIWTTQKPKGFCKRKKVWTRQHLQNTLQQMKEALNAMEEQVLGCPSEQTRSSKLRGETTLAKRPKKDPKTESVPIFPHESSFSDSLDRSVINRKESFMSYATVENMSAELEDDADHHHHHNNNNVERVLNELRSITKYFVKTLRNDWRETLPKDLNAENLIKSKWNLKELVHILTISIQFLCGRSAAISERESCLEAEMCRLEQFEKELNARETAILNKERKLVEYQRDCDRTIWREGRATKGFRKQTVVYLSIPASEVINDWKWKETDNSSESNPQLADLRWRVGSAEHRLKKIYHHLARSRNSLACSSSDSILSGCEKASSIRSEPSLSSRKNSMQQEFRTECLHPYSTLQHSFTEALKNISDIVQEQQQQQGVHPLVRAQEAVEVGQNRYL